MLSFCEKQVNMVNDLLLKFVPFEFWVSYSNWTQDVTSCSYTHSISTLVLCLYVQKSDNISKIRSSTNNVESQFHSLRFCEPTV